MVEYKALQPCVSVLARDCVLPELSSVSLQTGSSAVRLLKNINGESWKNSSCIVKHSAFLNDSIKFISLFICYWIRNQHLIPQSPKLSQISSFESWANMVQTDMDNDYI